MLTEMEKTIHCKCKTGCTSRRCPCLRNDEACDDKCECIDCTNPLNPEEIEKLLKWAEEFLEKYREQLKPPTIDDLRAELNDLLMTVQKMGANSIELESGYLYSRISNYLDEDAMAVCCEVMKDKMIDGDATLKELPRRQLLSIRYKLPR